MIEERRAAFARLQQARVEAQYAEMRAIDPDELEACVQRADAIGINHRLSERMDAAARARLLADIEGSLVSCALRNRHKGGQ